LAVELHAIAGLLFSFVVIVIGSEFFTNGIEWLGFRLRFSAGATGSVLAALGTAMPETMVPIIALLFGSTRELAQEIGIGAILGAPFMLSTLAMFIGGLVIVIASLLNKRSINLTLDRKATKRDLSFFFVVYTLAIVPALIKTAAMKYIVALVLVVCYAVYLKLVLSEMEPIGEADGALHFSKLSERLRPRDPHVTLIAIQVLAALGMIIGGARIFVGAIEKISLDMGISAAILAFVIAPMATELPEKANSVLWYLRGKDTLAMGNITGAMVFQSSILPAIGIAMTAWQLEIAEIGGMILAMAAAVSLYAALLRGRLNAYFMLVGGVVYASYIWYTLKSFA